MFRANLNLLNFVVLYVIKQVALHICKYNKYILYTAGEVQGSYHYVRIYIFIRNKQHINTEYFR